MKPYLVMPAVLLALGCGATARAAEAWYMRLDPHVYENYVADWSPADAPLCAVIRSRAEWNRILRAEPNTSLINTYSLPAAFARGDAVLLVAREINFGQTSAVFRPTDVERTPNAMEVDYRFKPTPPANTTISWYMALEVAKPLPPTVRFVENGREVCTLRPAEGDWVTPAQRR